MLILWLISFILGCIFGRSPWLGGYSLWAMSAITLQSLAFILILAIVTKLYFRIKPVVASLLVASVAFVWGYQNSAPITPRRGAQAVVVRVPLTGAFQGPVLAAREGRSVEIFGPQLPGAIGAVVFHPERALFSTGRLEMRARYTPAASCDPGASFCYVSHQLRSFILAGIERQPPHLQGWFAALLLGERGGMSSDLKDAFKNAGLVHVLSVSGLHVSLLALALGFVVRLPGQLAYSLRLLSPQTWRHLAALLNMIAALGAWFYAAMTGMSSAAQRAMFIYAIQQLLAIFYGRQPVRQRILFVAFLQTSLMPIGFLTEASLMSWAGYLMLVANGQQLSLKTKSWLVAARQLLILQLQLTIVGAAFFAQLSIPGILVNLIFLPLFPVVFGAAALAVVWPISWTSWMLAPLLAIQDSLCNLLDQIRTLCRELPWLYFDRADLGEGWRLLFCGLTVIFILNTCRHLSISPMDAATTAAKSN